MVFSRVGPNQSIEWGQIRVSKSAAAYESGHAGKSTPKKKGSKRQICVLKVLSLLFLVSVYRLRPRLRKLAG